MAAPRTDALVQREFWEEEYYWANLRPPVRPDPKLPFDRSLVAALEEVAPVRRGDTVMEVGCAPAKWLGFYGERFGAYVEGIEYSAKGASLSQANLDALGMSGRIHHADFFTVAPTQYDLVLSFGFIEHFDDLDSVFARHLEFVRPGGRLIIAVPNFSGVNRVLQQLADPAYLELHNLRAMSRDLYVAAARRHQLIVRDQRYVGGPDPIIVKMGRRWVTPIILAEARLRRLKRSERWNSGLFSPYLLTVFDIPAEPNIRS
jgi:SAM-dependent methyltransferase